MKLPHEAPYNHGAFVDALAITGKMRIRMCIKDDLVMSAQTCAIVARSQLAAACRR
jgi:hypothetical protein